VGWVPCESDQERIAAETASVSSFGEVEIQRRGYHKQ
jgi:hypothetical protein